MKVCRRHFAAGLLASGFWVGSPSRLGAQGASVRPELLEEFNRAQNRFDSRITKEGGVIVDFRLPSSVPRLFIVDEALRVVDSCHVSHGKGSDPAHSGRAKRFDGAKGSLTSVTGAIRGAEEYSGKHGRSLRLDGLEAHNRIMRERLIVLHTALTGSQYMEPAWIERHGRPGRSDGCFVVPSRYLDTVLTTLRDGGLLYAGR
jgi:hypothetical protein